MKNICKWFTKKSKKIMLICYMYNKKCFKNLESLPKNSKTIM